VKIIATYSIKGGVGKTAACVNMAYLSAQEKAPTLLFDLDPQGSSSFYFRIRPKTKYNSQKLIKGGKNIDKAIRGSDFEGLDLLPADLSYRNLDIILNDVSHSRTRLKRLLSRFNGEYEYVFLDCPPNITLVSENVFEAADAILVPLIPTTLSLLTYRKLDQFFVNSDLNGKKLHPFLSMVELRKRLHRDTMRELGDKMSNLLRSYIPYNAEIEKMGLYRAPLTQCRPTSNGSIAFFKLWKEISAHILKDRRHGN
jgi:cellulose biosynthesis protein BcsQ